MDGMTANITLTAAVSVLTSALVGVGLLAAVVSNPRRAKLERQTWNLLGVLLVACPLLYGLILAEQAPPGLSDRLDTILRQPHFGMTASDMMLAALLAIMIAGLTFETLRRWRHIPKGEGQTLLLVGFVFFNIARGRLSSPVIIELEFAFIAAMTIFAGRFAWLNWRGHDGGASA